MPPRGQSSKPLPLDERPQTEAELRGCELPPASPACLPMHRQSLSLWDQSVLRSRSPADSTAPPFPAAALTWSPRSRSSAGSQAPPAPQVLAYSPTAVLGCRTGWNRTGMVAWTRKSSNWRRRTFPPPSLSSSRLSIQWCSWWVWWATRWSCLSSFGECGGQGGEGRGVDSVSVCRSEPARCGISSVQGSGDAPR